jgi:hypothetical protein
MEDYFFVKNGLKDVKQFDENHFIANEENIVFQNNSDDIISYDKDYYDNYKNLEKTEMSFHLNKERYELVKKYSKGNVFDIGVGCGTFIMCCKDIDCFGYDINPFSVSWLKDKNIFLNPYLEGTEEISCWTMWDALEHFKDPQEILCKIKKNDTLIISIPIFENFLNLKKDKHFKPNEHFFYFTHYGLVSFLTNFGFTILHFDDFETKIGRHNINRYVFIKD